MKSINLPLVGIIVTLLSLPAASAEKTTSDNAISAPESTVEYFSPDSIDGSTKVDTDAVVELIYNIENLVMIDSRIKEDRAYGYIEGSISLPDIETSCSTLKQEIPAPASSVLFYCNGAKCARSVRAVNIAKECGYSEIYWYREGFADWEAKNLPFIKPD